MESDVLDWPFFDAHHGVLARELDAWAAANLADAHGTGRLVAPRGGRR
jgi:acyl-CoA dehydrogenase